MSLSINAKAMISSVTCNSTDKAANIGKFLRAANSKWLQGPALVSYFTEYNKVAANKNQLTKEAADRFEKLPKLIEQEINKDSKLQREARTFKLALQQMYPKTLEKRISLASEGAVTSDKVEPQSRFKKIMVAINQLIKEC